ncbi:Hypothetical protein GLP15_3953 [Giardia lamblia P15]|uniref:Phosphate-starvation-inducible E n=1 Tax=Giardia intestinalis (strain P15) TaxID=658858 RepID=E1F2I3_GIAIA|nr:Hypothetical protein GLP15_3953 [Giardia lamblia P15]
MSGTGVLSLDLSGETAPGHTQIIDFAKEELAIQEATDEISLDIHDESLVIASPDTLFPSYKQRPQHSPARSPRVNRLSQKLQSIKTLTSLAINTIHQMRKEHIIKGRTLLPSHLPTITDDANNILSTSRAHRCYFRIVLVMLFIYDKYVLLPAGVITMIALVMSVIHAGYSMVKAYMEHPHMVLDTMQYLEVIRSITLVLLVAELFDSLLTQISTGYDHIRYIILIGIMASARQLIFIDPDSHSFTELIGFGSLCLSLGAVFALLTADPPKI